MRALLIGNASDCDAGFSGERFRQHGYSFVECHRERPAEWTSLAGIDLVMLLGSEWSVYWAKVAQQVAAEQAVVNAAHTAGVPVYGICFGAQMIAAALGGSVARAHVPEIGWYDNIVSELPNVIPPGPWMQWHSDIVALPPGAQELARSPLATQAFRIGRTFATQFHPEVTEAMATRWALSPNAEAELQRVGLTAEELRTLTSKNVIASRPNAERIVDWFLDEVAGK